jgi:ABC-2 type transport system permease protein
LLALTVANFKMMARNRHTTFWALFFPLTLVVVFGLFDGFSGGFGGGSATLEVVDLDQTSGSAALVRELSSLESLEVSAGVNPQQARRRLESGELDYFLAIPPGYGESRQGIGGPDPVFPNPVSLVHTSRNPERNQLVAGAITNLVANLEADPATASGVVSETAPALEVGEVPSPEESYAGASYFDVALLGLVGLGVMTNSIISIAVKISVYRSQSILKRMLVTPLAIRKYFAAEITAHLVLALVQAGIILAVGVFVFGAQIHGNLVWVFIIVLLGSLVFLNIGFILSAWANTPSAASSMGNAIALPMLFLAGTFFSTTSLPWLLPYAAEALPLTPMLSALRDVAIDNAALWQVWPQLAALGCWIAITSLAAIKVFRFS